MANKGVQFAQKVFSGIQPTGVPHLGNYFGAIAQWKKLQENTVCLYSIVDLHSITMPHFQKNILRSNIELMTASLLATGIKPDTIFLQSTIPEHGQLGWIFNCLSTMNKMYHFPQFKEKSVGMKETPLGLYLYPILQSADVLLYKGTHVPVGEDQLPHIHLIKDIAETFNKRFQAIVFPYCEPILDTESARLRDLRNPLKKMSKSGDQRGRIDLNEQPDSIRRKIRKALTDCESSVRFDPLNRPGVANLIQLHSLCSGRSIETIENESSQIDTGKYKSVVADSVADFVGPIREKTADLMKNKEHLWGILNRNSERIQPEAAQTMLEVRKAMGLA